MSEGRADSRHGRPGVLRAPPKRHIGRGTVKFDSGRLPLTTEPALSSTQKPPAAWALHELYLPLWTRLRASALTTLAPVVALHQSREDQQVQERPKQCRGNEGVGMETTNHGQPRLSASLQPSRTDTLRQPKDVHMLTSMQSLTITLANRMSHGRWRSNPHEVTPRLCGGEVQNKICFGSSVHELICNEKTSSHSRSRSER